MQVRKMFIVMTHTQLTSVIIFKIIKIPENFQACGALECAKNGFVQANSKA